MKFSIKTSIALACLVMACAEPDAVTPVPSTTPSTYTADFSFINAVADGPANGLDFYVNNLKIGSTHAFLNGVGHTTTPITTNGVGANTNIRVKASGGTIGGILDANDLIYRAGNNNNNNFVATSSNATTTIRYTLIALDSINRPAPARKLNALNFGDTTFYNKANGQYISTVERAALTAAQKAQVVAIGTVPLGSSDPGGPRFLLNQDTYPAALATTTTQFGLRFINGSPNAPTLFARLVPATGTAITVGNGGYILSFPTLTPSVGSHSRNGTGANAPVAIMLTTLPGANVGPYSIEVATDAAFANKITLAGTTHTNITLTIGKVYTVVISGKYGKTLAAGAVKQN